MKSIFIILIFSISFTSSYSMKNRNRRNRKVKIYHCTSPENVEKILKDGLKSRRQLEYEGKRVKVDSFEPLPGHYESIYFQWIDSNRLTKVKPYVWQRNEDCSQCIAIEVDPCKTKVYNPDLRISSPFGKNISENKTALQRQGVYESSGIPLAQYIATKKRLYETKCNSDHILPMPHPLTAEPECIFREKFDKYTPYYWNEHTIKINRIDPSKFVQ